MEGKSSEFKSLCSSSGKKCDLHFMMENEVLQTKERVDRLDERQTMSYDALKTSITDLVMQMRTYMAQQEFRDALQQDVKSMTMNNADDINELKSSIKSVESQIKSVGSAVVRMERSIISLSVDIKDLDKTVLNKGQIIEVVRNSIVADKNTERGQWFESLPAKASAGVAILSFITFFTIKIVVMILAI